MAALDVGVVRVRGHATREERLAVEDLLSEKMSRNLGPDYEPTERGAGDHDAIGAFLLRWPIEHA
ncbi:hypothetical protein MOQ72_32375 [Saccharopolyspora sp. K220]|uniref:hypothetical protein n=1 Tax=Saccharopolyspora soli TaxID=2926618 RepID=UPI001F58A184|nr:hypothetical protein [Saccharopolyspora soli]MCI2422137.1 hypothetical protein [Saccharopolyspora soli]